MEIGLVRIVDIEQEMQQAYLDYAMSVIVARALPDARDGLKPVHRRILYAMYDMGMRPDSPYKKSARIVGEVLGKYHPHGDMAVYDAMARMAQDFSMRYPLVDGQGNFGSVDGDPPAAMRYTEARLTPLAMQMLADIQKDTVDFVPNFDDTLTEPSVLPAAIPNLLVNGATGIAVGMSTNIPPHNLSEVVDALIFLLDNWRKLDDISVEDLMRFIQGPDFPTGGVIVADEESDALRSAYGTGRGKITLQALAHVEQMSRGRSAIVITELPYMTNKSSLIERIAALVREGKLEGLADLRDESDRQGMRIVIELTKTADPEAVLRELYRRTPLRTTVSIIMLALVDGEPRLLSLKQALRVYLEHRLTIVRRRSEYDLDKARRRAHILEGLRVALKNLDEVIALIRKARDVDTARRGLMRRFKLTEVQAQAILDMQLRRLSSLERKKIDLEYKEVLATIKRLETLLKSPKKMRQAVAEELQQVKEAFGDGRRTRIARLATGQDAAQALTSADLLPDQRVWVLMDVDGNLVRLPEGKAPRQSGRAAPVLLAEVNTRDTLYLVTADGKAAAVPVHALPEGERAENGAPFARLSPLRSHQTPVALFALPGSDPPQEGYVVTVSRAGMVKKSALSDLPGPSAHAFTLARVNDGDELFRVLFTGGKDDILLVTAHGMAIRFSEEDVRPMGLEAAGVMGIKLKVGDVVVGAETVPPRKSGSLFIVTDHGHAKRVPFSDFPCQGRYGQGVVAWKLPRGRSLVGAAIGRDTLRVTLHLAQAAPKMCRLDAAPQRKRASVRGAAVVELKPGDEVVEVTVPVRSLSLKRRG